jgi:hypothetical protein
MPPLSSMHGCRHRDCGLRSECRRVDPPEHPRVIPVDSTRTGCAVWDFIVPPAMRTHRSHLARASFA